MFAFSAFGRGPHTEYYFIHQGDGGGGWGGAERLLEAFTLWAVIIFDYSETDSLKWIKYCNLAYTCNAHTNRVLTPLATHASCRIACLQKVGVCEPEASAWAKCIISGWFMEAHHTIYAQKESTCLIPLHGDLIFALLVCVLWGYNGIWWGD